MVIKRNILLFRSAVVILLLVLAVALALQLLSPEPEETDTQQAEVSGIFPDFARENWRGDLDAMKERNVVRALVTPSLTDFFSLEGKILGIQAELLQQFEEQINRDNARGEIHTRIVYIPVPFNQLIPALLEGRGDIAAAVLTATPAREEIVDIVGSSQFRINEVVVHGRAVKEISAVTDLAGRTIHVLSGSSYVDHLAVLNEQFESQDLEPVNVIEVDPHLRTEDIFEFVNAGFVDITVSDDYKAMLWEKVLPNIVVREDLEIRSDAVAGWAIRKGNPKLRQAIARLYREAGKGTLLGNIFMQRYFGSTQWINNPLAQEERELFIRYSDLFKEYGTRYGFDWLALAAQAYQESGLDHSRRSPAGAVGIMQLLPSTAADKNVGIPDIENLENNIHAGAKYMAFIRDRYFPGTKITDEADRLAFSWAAYNAGPRKVQRMRRHAENLGLDPDRWFENVEYAAMDIVGRETVQYVANIYKYYTAYRLSEHLVSARDEALQRIEQDEG